MCVCVFCELRFIRVAVVHDNIRIKQLGMVSLGSQNKNQLREKSP